MSPSKHSLQGILDCVLIVVVIKVIQVIEVITVMIIAMVEVVIKEISTAVITAMNSMTLIDI